MWLSHSRFSKDDIIFQQSQLINNFNKKYLKALTSSNKYINNVFGTLQAATCHWNPRVLQASAKQPSFIFSFIFHLKLKSHRRVHEKYRFHPCPVGGKDPMRQKDTSTARRGQNRRERGKKSHSVSFEPVSPCWVEFDIQTMRQGSIQGGRLPCNINSHLESSCGYGHETLKETAAMDPVPSRHRSHCLLKRPPHCSLKPAWNTTQTGSYSLCSFPFDPLWVTYPICAMLEWLGRCRQHLDEENSF